MRTRTVIPAACAAALTVALLGACGGGSGDTGDRSGGGATESNGEDETSAGPNTGTGAETAVKAMDTAAGDVDDGAVLDLELDDDGKQQWEVTVASGTKTEFELRISPDGAEVESSNEDDDLDDDLAKLADAKLSAQDAAKRAVEDHPGDVTGVDFETDDADNKTLVWQVTLDDDGAVTEYTLDADTGKTLGSEKED